MNIKNTKITNDKTKLRNHIWNLLYEKALSYRINGDFGKIPDFKGKLEASKYLQNTKEWKNAKTIFSSPDSAQIPVRRLALEDDKTLIMASPNLKDGYLFLEGRTIENVLDASTKEGAYKYQSTNKEINKIDLVIEGSVAVDKKGNRLGKGKGYGDREIGDLINKGLINLKTPITTTVHSLQIVDNVPIEEHDMKLNMIVSNESVIHI